MPNIIKELKATEEIPYQGFFTRNGNSKISEIQLYFTRATNQFSIG